MIMMIAVEPESHPIVMLAHFARPAFSKLLVFVAATAQKHGMREIPKSGFSDKKE